MLDDKTGIKKIKAGKLIEILETLDKDAEVFPNKVGNLKVESPSGEYIGFIDLLWDTLESWEDIK